MPAITWAAARFGGEGPLLEFVYLVNQNASLRARLRDQVRRLQDEVRTGARSVAELQLLRLVSVAAAYAAVVMRAPRLAPARLRLGIVYAVRNERAAANEQLALRLKEISDELAALRANPAQPVAMRRIRDEGDEANGAALWH